MAEIIFQSKKDAKRFYNHLLTYLPCISDEKTILLIEDRHIVQVLDGSFSNEMFHKVKTAFYDFITTVKRNDWFRDIIKNHYFFHNEEEQHQIIEIIYSILEGQREDLVIFLKETNKETSFIEDAVDQMFHGNVSFSFDSLLKFRLRPYLQMLEEYVELAIDEYKMEQEYQMFIQMLRDFLVKREPKMATLHVLFDEEITFYNEELAEIKRAELTRMIDRKLLVNHPVYVDSVSIAPLLSIAPTSIYLYTNNPDEPLVRTIKNIFEERVVIKNYTALRSLKKWTAEPGSSENHA
ncbi:putative sporulation protein YtxC [Bacillus sp. AFS076308]|uniref:putative sporulation protein YtxC n=1 Tax=unclassified Bacillus (in: firmicutes) TaxID=185979 RepID=UPI000BF9AECB|nr:MULTISPECIES: putative sporulation protein YtxC [unclassified Bacillus (in: firmicutes)]PFN79503.1 putative sporulation protein YtxC [Bacillus sp. AFS076308]PGV48917.1 putative sporulation protein YtxC [Bacillus sp. AFS037270]